MASKRTAIPAKHLFNGFRTYEQQTAPQRCFARSMQTEAATLQSPPTQTTPPPTQLLSDDTQQPPQNPFLQTAQCTLYNFPSLEPVSFVEYPSTHLLLPLRKDILHRAVIFEGDATRKGFASTKWRSEVHGSNRKVRPQKGTGSARLGDKKSPMLRGGGVAFGPKPRDFSTDLPQKVYDRAWRTALSYRYRKGQLVVVESEIDVSGVHEHSLERYMADILRWNKLDRTAGGKSLFLTMERREGLYSALESGTMYRQARAIDAAEVDVKDLLEGGRVVVERSALEHLFDEHETDLPDRLKLSSQMPELYGIVE